MDLYLIELGFLCRSCSAILSLNGDTSLPNDNLKVWKIIAIQVNSSPAITLSRCVGERSDSYSLVAFVDSSSVMVGVTVYIYNEQQRKASFLLAKNKIIGKTLADKGIPTLERTAIDLDVQCLSEINVELAGKDVVIPVKFNKFFLFSDSMVCLNWLNQYAHKKMSNKSVYVRNRLKSIASNCDILPIEFKFCNGIDNPADCMTREVSYKVLMRSSFHAGPLFLMTDGPSVDTPWSIVLPNPSFSRLDNVQLTALDKDGDPTYEDGEDHEMVQLQESTVNNPFDPSAIPSMSSNLIDYSRFPPFQNVKGN